MTSSEIIAEYTRLGELKAQEALLGEAMIKLTADQRKAHRETLEQIDRISNLENDRKVEPIIK